MMFTKLYDVMKWNRFGLYFFLNYSYHWRVPATGPT
eukprot:UN12991